MPIRRILPLPPPTVDSAPSGPMDVCPTVPTPSSATTSLRAKRAVREDASQGCPVGSSSGSDGGLSAPKRVMADATVDACFPEMRDVDEKESTAVLPTATYAAATAAAAAGPRAALSPLVSSSATSSASASASLSASSPASAPASSSSASSPSTTASGGGAAAVAAAGAVTAAVLDASVASSLSAENYLPLSVARAKLLAVNIDNRRPASIYVDVAVDARFPSAPKIDKVYFGFNDECRLRFTADWLGSAKGLAIEPPLLPRCFVQPAAPHRPILPPQQEWLDEFHCLMRKHVVPLTDKTTSLDDRNKAAAELNTHLSALLPDESNPSVTGLWPKDELVTSWAQLLAPRSCILRCRTPSQPTAMNQPPPSHYTYQLALHGATPEATYVITSVISEYAAVRAVNSDITAAVDKILPPDAEAAVTSSDSSDDSQSDGDTWQRAASKRRLSSTARRNRAAVAKELAVFASNDLLVKNKGSYVTSQPLLALAASVTIRPMQIPYMSVVIDNWQSIGCNSADLADCPIYKRVISSLAELRHGSAAHWSVDQRLGNAAVHVWLPQEHKALMARLNSILCEDRTLGLRSSALRIWCTAAQRTRRGRINTNTLVKIHLCGPTVVAPPLALQRPASAAAAAVFTTAQQVQSAPAPDSWVGRVVESLARRKAQQSAQSLNHRPRKEQRTEPPQPAHSSQAAEAPASSSSSNATKVVLDTNGPNPPTHQAASVQHQQPATLATNGAGARSTEVASHKKHRRNRGSKKQKASSTASASSSTDAQPRQHNAQPVDNDAIATLTTRISQLDAKLSALQTQTTTLQTQIEPVALNQLIQQSFAAFMQQQLLPMLQQQMLSIQQQMQQTNQQQMVQVMTEMRSWQPLAALPAASPPATAAPAAPVSAPASPAPNGQAVSHV